MFIKIDLSSAQKAHILRTIPQALVRQPGGLGRQPLGGGWRLRLPVCLVPHAQYTINDTRATALWGANSICRSHCYPRRGPAGELFGLALSSASPSISERGQRCPPRIVRMETGVQPLSIFFSFLFFFLFFLSFLPTRALLMRSYPGRRLAWSRMPSCHLGKHLSSQA